MMGMAQTQKTLKGKRTERETIATHILKGEAGHGADGRTKEKGERHAAARGPAVESRPPGNPACRPPHGPGCPRLVAARGREEGEGDRADAWSAVRLPCLTSSGSARVPSLCAGLWTHLPASLVCTPVNPYTRLPCVHTCKPTYLPA